MAGKFIVIYGANNLGKSTQVALLVESLREKGIHAKCIKYPIYDLEPTGPLINAVLRQGKKMPERKLQKTYVQNRRDYEPQLKKMLKAGKWIIAEDYVGTGIAWGMVRGVPLQVLEKMNKDLFPAHAAIVLYGTRFNTGNEENHRNEMDNGIWNLASKNHELLAKRYGWKKVLANQSKEKVQKDILAILESEGFFAIDGAAHIQYHSVKNMAGDFQGTKRRYGFDAFPYEQDLQKFAIPYTPEKFSPEEEWYLKPFFTNLDKPVFVVQNLPEEVVGAVSSRYSRSTISLRRLFLKEYIFPIIFPERQKDWSQLSPMQKATSHLTREQFLNFINTWHSTGGIDEVVNVQRGRKFFEKWLAEYGDDSIAEMGGIHLCIEGLSMIATKELQDKRIGLSTLEKSTRYVQYWEKRLDGEYQYIIPGEIRQTKFKKLYQDAMDDLMDTYVQIAEPYLEYIKERYPKETDETDRSFENSRGAKRFDDIRDILPFSTQTNVAFFGNGRSFEDLISRCLDHPLGEVRWIGQAITYELRNVPSFVQRSKTERGAQVQIYRGNIHHLREELVVEFLDTHEADHEIKRLVNLVSFTPDADVEIISEFFFSAAHGKTLEGIRREVAGFSQSKRRKILERIFEERKFGKNDAKREEIRFRKVPRAFENAKYLFEIWARGGDYRDLQRHRMMTQERQLFTTLWGYDLEKDVLLSPFQERISHVLEKASQMSRELATEISAYVAQYAVPFAYLQHWYINLTAREIYWMVELRTGSQGRPHYREICQHIAKQATQSSPAVFSGLMVDTNDYRLARRESEKKIEAKLKTLETGSPR